MSQCMRRHRCLRMLGFFRWGGHRRLPSLRLLSHTAAHRWWRRDCLVRRRLRRLRRRGGLQWLLLWGKVGAWGSVGVGWRSSPCFGLGSDQGLLMLLLMDNRSNRSGSLGLHFGLKLMRWLLGFLHDTVLNRCCRQQSIVNVHAHQRFQRRRSKKQGNCLCSHDPSQATDRH